VTDFGDPHETTNTLNSLNFPVTVYVRILVTVDVLDLDPNV